MEIEPRTFVGNRSEPTPTPKKRKSDLIAGSQPDEGEAGSDEEFGWADDEPFNIPDLEEQLATY